MCSLNVEKIDRKTIFDLDVYYQFLYNFVKHQFFIAAEW